MKSVCLKFGFFCVCLAFLYACQNGEVAQQDAITVPGVSVAGSIAVLASNAVDSDVNNNTAYYKENDSLVSAQAIPDAITLGGYVNVANSGPQGRSFQSGDTDDYFSSFLLANQSIILTVDSDSSANLDLSLLNSDGNVVQSVNAITDSASLTTNAADKFSIHIQINSGAASYVLQITEPVNIAATNLLSVDHVMEDFVPGEFIIKFKPRLIVANNNALSKPMRTPPLSAAQRAKSVGLQHKGGAQGRNMLFTVGSAKGRQKAMSLLGIKQSRPASVDASTQLKRDTVAIVNSLRKRADVESARLNYIRHANAVPNDTHYNLQWHYDQISLPQAWDITTGSAQVTVAVIDTGVLLNHPDLQGKLLAGYDFIRDINNSVDGDGIDDNPNDDGDGGVGGSSFHGTHVAGTIAAASNNGVGVAGVAWNVNIMPLRVLGPLGGTDYDIEQAVRFAAGLENDSNTLPPVPADVINLSLGGPTGSTVAPEAFQLARQAGVIIVAAAGNESVDQLSYPASLDGVVSVSAIDINDQIAPYSNFGSTVDVSAPGGDTSVDNNSDGFVDGVLSTWADDSGGNTEYLFAFLQGTSMAAPHVAGVAALMRSVDPALSPAEFDQMLSSGAISDDLGATGRDDQFGHGRINAFKAVSEVESQLGSNSDPGDAQLVLSPEYLNFSHSANALQLVVGKEGAGNLTGLNLSSNISWLSFTAVAVDNDGLGTYTVSVDRSGLAAGTYLVSADIITDQGNEQLSVAMQVLDSQTTNNVGVQYVSILDALENVVQTVQVEPLNDVYDFQFDDIPPGTYKLITHSDNDANGGQCGIAEACGTYQDAGNNELFIIESSNTLDRDFNTGYP